VDRSIDGPRDFVETNLLGTFEMLEASRHHRTELPPAERDGFRFLHVSTDEVYGSLDLDGHDRFTELTPLDPTSPYAASKTASDHLVLAAHRTHGLDTVITRCSNNYGPYQFPEKFIPLFVSNALVGEKLPLYGDGKHVRDWIHVDNHVRGLKLVWERGEAGSVYNLGGQCERANRDIAAAIVAAAGADEALIQPVRDRPAHDRRYAIDPSRALALGFDPGPPIEERMPEIVEWYRSHRDWWERIKAGEYRDYYERMYHGREV
jgi:dTDP-glucose 4,6-dehydratase